MIMQGEHEKITLALIIVFSPNLRFNDCDYPARFDALVAGIRSDLLTSSWGS